MQMGRVQLAIARRLAILSFHRRIVVTDKWNWDENAICGLAVEQCALRGIWQLSGSRGSIH